MSASHHSSPLAGCSVLIVEDQYLIAEEMCELVERLGGTVIGPVPRVSEALEALEEAKPDLALLDVDLGSEKVYVAAEALRAAGTPFLFTTGYDRGAIDSRFSDVLRLEKPVSLTALVAALGQLNSI
ncbi:response regulator [Roseomonas xinghualingensis]|uniref:response regulator n=1 Tax=Roseomonas xinghualingensis TaxID=2986475 RepID=UPI0021F122C2|nr:response regulator [Roseomonas sp. SXEYE001]MCV4206952.1 response regulator [Roseomonas sp. SXEYE001]